MKPSDYGTAKALCNLASLGWSLDRAKKGAQRWAEGQIEFGVSQLRLADAFKPIDTVEPIEAGRLYLTGRYGCHPKIFKTLGKASAGRTLYCPAGNLGEQIGKRAKLMSRVSGTKVEFLPISIPAIRSLKEKLAEGHNVLLFFDIPFRSGLLTKDAPVETSIGLFRATAALSRLPAMIDPDFRGIYCERREGRDTIAPMGQADFSAVIEAFADQIRANPVQYEALPDLHRNWTLPDRPDIAVLFDHLGDRMLLHARSMRAWKLGADLSVSEQAARYADEQQRMALAEKLGVRIDAVLTL